MKLNKRHALRGDDGRASELTARWWTISFTPDGVDRSWFLDDTIYWSPLINSIRERYFRRMYPRAQRRPFGREMVNRPKRIVKAAS